MRLCRILARRCLLEIFAELANIHSGSFLPQCSRRLNESLWCLPIPPYPHTVLQDGESFEGLEPSLKIVQRIFIYPIVNC